jgi:hypothetical protein
MVSAYDTLKSGRDHLVPKMDSRARPPEEASGRFCPQAGFDEPTRARDEYDATLPATRKTLEPVLFQVIIRFLSKVATNMEDDRRPASERPIAAHSSSLLKRK